MSNEESPNGWKCDLLYYKTIILLCTFDSLGAKNAKWMWGWKIPAD